MKLWDSEDFFALSQRTDPSFGGGSNGTDLSSKRVILSPTAIQRGESRQVFWRKGEESPDK